MDCCLVHSLEYGWITCTVPGTIVSNILDSCSLKEPIFIPGNCLLFFIIKIWCITVPFPLTQENDHGITYVHVTCRSISRESCPELLTTVSLYLPPSVREAPLIDNVLLPSSKFTRAFPWKGLPSLVHVKE